MIATQEQHNRVHAAFRSARNALPMFVVYRPTTSDHKGKWVARMHLSLPQCPTDLLLESDTLAGVRSQLPPEAIKIARSTYDDPVIE